MSIPELYLLFIVYCLPLVDYYTYTCTFHRQILDQVQLNRNDILVVLMKQTFFFKRLKESRVFFFFFGIETYSFW